MSMTSSGTGRSLANLRAGHASAERGGFDLDAFHAMDQRDNALVADELMHGSLSSKFVYNFNISGKMVAGVSVIGARHLASHYGGLKHRIIASCEKKGATHFFRSYPNGETPMSATVLVLHDMADDPDYYTVVVELTDVKRGLSMQVEKTELRMEKRRDGSLFERPHYQIIAQSKAYRNAVLDLVPQDVVIRFRQECLRLGDTEDLTADVLDEKRRAVLAYATSKGITVDRMALQALGLTQIGGLSAAAQEGPDAFAAALVSVGLAQASAEEAASPPTSSTSSPSPSSKAGPTPKTRAPRAKEAAPAIAQEQTIPTNIGTEETRQTVSRTEPQQEDRTVPTDEMPLRTHRAQPTDLLKADEDEDERGFGSGE